jgi:hypothetical protein
MVQFLSCDRNDRSTIMTVQVPALPGVVQEAMTVTEIDLASHPKHNRAPAATLKEEEDEDCTNRQMKSITKPPAGRTLSA